MAGREEAPEKKTIAPSGIAPSIGITTLEGNEEEEAEGSVQASQLCQFKKSNTARGRGCGQCAHEAVPADDRAPARYVEQQIPTIADQRGSIEQHCTVHDSEGNELYVAVPPASGIPSGIRIIEWSTWHVWLTSSAQWLHS